jgi:hypothetical protein
MRGVVKFTSKWSRLVTAFELTQQIIRFLGTRRAKSLCAAYHADPRAALGELYLRLLPRSTTKDIKNPAVWVATNGRGVLQNYLRRECVIRP